MTDYELNLKMAKVCGFPVLGDVERHEAPPLFVAECETDAMKWIMLHRRDVDGWDGSEPWNPCGDWNQLHKYVLPAMSRAGFGVAIDLFVGSDSSRVLIVRGLGDGYGEAKWQTSKPTPCPVCEAILEAIEKMEGDHGTA